MATPNYKGAGQPTANSGLLSGLGSWFGGATPAYAGAAQSSSGSSKYVVSAAPQAPATTVTAVPCSDPERITIVIPRELIESQS